MITKCVAMHDQTEKVVRLISFFTLHAHNFAGFIMQSLLGQTFFNFWFTAFYMKCQYVRGKRGVHNVYLKFLKNK